MLVQDLDSDNLSLSCSAPKLAATSPAKEAEKGTKKTSHGLHGPRKNTANAVKAIPDLL
jgi:hypothetical protein